MSGFCDLPEFQQTRRESDTKLALANMSRKGILGLTGLQEWIPHSFGRVIDPHVEVFAKPSFEAERI